MIKEFNIQYIILLVSTTESLYTLTLFYFVCIGPETGYRVLKTVKGAHLPAVFPFETPDIIPADFYDYGAEKDVFDTAASGTPFKPGTDNSCIYTLTN